MQKNLIRLVAFLGISALLVTGCSSSLKEENKALTEKNTGLEEKITKQTEEIDDLKSQMNSFNQLKDLVSSDGTLLPVYTANIDDYSDEILCYISVSGSGSLKEKLQTIGNSLSRFYFGSLAIEVTEIDGNNIASIDLKDSGAGQGASWSRYFQGSAGGTITTKTLLSSFLQKEYSGEWVKGVKFTLNGKNIESEHVPELAQINYR